MARLVCVAAAFALSFSSMVFGAGADQPLQPVGKWVVDYAETQCGASRQYGNPAKPIVLGIRPAPNGETYELLAIFKRPGPILTQELEGRVDFGRGTIKAWLLRYGAKPNDHVVYDFRITAAQMAQGLTAHMVTLSADGGPDASFSLASIPALLKSLEQCTADLQRYWNMGGEKDGRIATPARGDMRSLFSSDDFPKEAFDRRQQGSGQFLLLIDEKGSVAGCHVLKTAGIPAFDGMACSVLRKRAKFTPARDRAGKAIRSSVVTPPIVWKLR